MSQKYLMKMAYKLISYNDPPYKGECLLSGFYYDMMIIIPAYAEENIIDTIESIKRSQDKRIHVGLLICINEGENSDRIDIKINENTYASIRELINDWNEEALSLHCIYVKEIPHKWAGVGMARRIAIEQAAQMLKDPISPIVNLDADCEVSENYIEAIYEYFKFNKHIELANIHYEHPIDAKINVEKIINYEAHLRYFIGIQKYIGLPYAYHTVGSSFAVRAKAYKQVGGMNKRKAGEDFYFIHKFTKKGTIGETGSCTVFPSARISTRVPFGTGRAMQQIEKENKYYTYSPESFRILKDWLLRLPLIYRNLDADGLYDHADLRLVSFLRSIQASEIIIKLKSNVTRYDLFLKSFFQWFDGFVLMKYLHYVRDLGLEDIDIKQALDQCAEELKLSRSNNLLEYLTELRQMDKASKYNGHEQMLLHYSF